MGYMQAIFTTLWTIWTHWNVVIHEGKEPNPMEVALTAQNLSCRYKEAFSSQSVSNSKCRRTEPKLNTAAGQWQLIIKIAGVRRRKAKRSAWAYEAKNLQGVIMFCVVASSTAISTYGAVQEALVEAAIKARSQGYHQQQEEPRLAREDYGCWSKNFVPKRTDL